MSVQTVKQLVNKYLMLAGLGQKHCSVHKLRHTAATLMYQNGVDVRTLKEVLGHENLDTTMIYTHIVDENLRDAAARNPLSGQKPKK
jgi:site-specific recombinase XerD